MPFSSRAPWLILAALALGACDAHEGVGRDAAVGGPDAAGDASGFGDAAGLDGGSIDGSIDGAPAVCPKVPGGADRALVVSLIRDNNNDAVDVYTLESGGRVVDHGLEFTGFGTPQQVAMRSDGREAMVSYGYIGVNYGVAVFTIQPDGSGAAMSQNLMIGSGMNMLALTYASDDHAVLAVGAGTVYNFVAIDRGTDGKFTVGPTTPISATFPIQLQPRPGTNRALLVRSDLLNNDTTTELQTIALGATAGAGWAKVGTSGVVMPPSIRAAVSADGLRVYSPSPDPAMAGSLTPDGLLHVYHYSGDDLIADPTYLLPHASALLTLSPDGKFLVSDNGIIEDRGTGPSVYSYRLQTTQLDANGAPTSTMVTQTPIEGVTFHSFALTASGLLVTAMELLPKQATAPDKVYPLLVWRQKAPGDWQPICGTTYLTGQPRVGIAP